MAFSTSPSALLFIIERHALHLYRRSKCPEGFDIFMDHFTVIFFSLCSTEVYSTCTVTWGGVGGGGGGDRQTGRILTASKTDCAGILIGVSC